MTLWRCFYRQKPFFHSVAILSSSAPQQGLSRRAPAHTSFAAALRLGAVSGLMGWPSQLWTSKFPTLEPEVVPSRLCILDGTTSGSKVGNLEVQSWEGHPISPEATCHALMGLRLGWLLNRLRHRLRHRTSYRLLGSFRSHHKH